MPLSREDHARLDLGRLQRLQESLAAAGCGAALLTEPLNIRYATGTARSTLWNLHGATRYALVPVSGRAVVFDNPGAHHVYGDRAAVGEYRPAISTCFWTAGPNLAREAAASAADIAALLRAAAGDNRTLAYSSGHAAGEDRRQIPVEHADRTPGRHRQASARS